MTIRAALLPHQGSAAPRDARGTLLYAARALLLLAAVGAIALYPAAPSLPRRYFVEQDLPLLLLAAGGLWLLARIRSDGAPIGPRAMAWRWPMILTATAFAYAGAHWLLGRYPVSRDEILADFQAMYLAHGRLGWPIPPALRDVGEAMMPLWSNGWLGHGQWVSGYLPVNSGLRALASISGDIRLAGPALLAVGAGAIWSAARRLWPDRPRGAMVALVIALTSTQVLATAMTPYAMTAHFALNAVWLACFLRGGRRGHAAAILVGLAASGLHQVHFHLLFVAGPLLWLAVTRQYRLALLYAAACIGYVLVWLELYPRLLVALMGEPAVPLRMPAVSAFAARFARLLQWDPFTSIARFVAWQNVLLAPLAVLGLRATRDADRRPTILWGLAATCLIGLATTIFQGHGYGYRYLHGAIPAFCLLAAAGWMQLEKEAGRALPAALLWGSAAFALLVTLPFALWRSHQFVAPYEGAYRAVRAVPADVVLVDTRAGAFLQDIVRYDPAAPAPLVLDLGYVPAARIARWCRDGTRVALFAQAEAEALGVMPAFYGEQRDPDTAARRRQLDELRCATRVPPER